MRLRILLLLSLVACGGHAVVSKSGPATVQLPPANPLAVSIVKTGTTTTPGPGRSPNASATRIGAQE